LYISRAPRKIKGFLASVYCCIQRVMLSQKDMEPDMRISNAQ
jgi:hypothetical protein